MRRQSSKSYSNYANLLTNELHCETLIKSVGSPQNLSIIEELHDYSYLERMSGKTGLMSSHIFFAILLIAFGTSLIAAIIDISAYNLVSYKKQFSFEFDPLISLLIFTSISIFFVLIGTSLGYYFTPDADGSGIPEIKAILSGVDLPKFLMWKTFFLKALGLVCCSASLSIGREGPHIHLAAIIAHKLMKIRYFSRLKNFKASYSQIIQASVTAGVAAVMGTPIGATFFSIEITASYYIVHNLISALMCGVFCSVFLSIYHKIYLTEDFDTNSFVQGYNNFDLILACALGICCGVLGICFIKLSKLFNRLRSRRAVLFVHKRFRYAVLVAVTYSVASWALPTLRLSAKNVFNEMISHKDLSEVWSHETDLNLLGFTVAKLFFTALSISVQIPFGIFLPVLDSGACIGRFIGKFAEGMGGIAHSSMYAAIGGAALISSSTHALSVTLIIFEITGTIKYVIPMTLSVVIACSISKAFELSIYDVSIQSRNLPFLPAMRQNRLYDYEAKDIMEKAHFLMINSKLKDLKECLEFVDSFKIPIVDEKKYLIAEVSARRIKKYFEFCMAEYRLSEKEKEIVREFVNGTDDYQFRGDKDEDLIKQEESIRMCKERVEEFLETRVNFNEMILAVKRDPISVEENMNLSKIHFMFHMLGLMKIFVTKNFQLVGIIKRENFTGIKK